jgi:methanogenic corrinoid protein MtbC1
MSTEESHAQLAEKLRSLEQPLTEATAEAFFRRHPEWAARFDDARKKANHEEAVFHVRYLATAVEVGAAAPFVEYVRWTRRVLEARGLSPQFLREALEDSVSDLRSRLSVDEASLVVPLLSEGILALASSEDAIELSKDNPLAGTEQEFLAAIMSGDRKAALRVSLGALESGVEVLDLYGDVIQTALYEVGRRWESNRITVADEHMATVIAQYVLANIYSQQEAPSMERGKAVIAGVQGELHQIGPNMVADALEADGWDVRFLGTNTPLDTVVEVVREHKADLLGISATMTFNVHAVSELVASVADLGAGRPRILLGGAAFRQMPHLVKELEGMGVRGWAGDVRAAVTMARTL